MKRLAFISVFFIFSFFFISSVSADTFNYTSSTTCYDNYITNLETINNTISTTISRYNYSSDYVIYCYNSTFSIVFASSSNISATWQSTGNSVTRNTFNLVFNNSGDMGQFSSDFSRIDIYSNGYGSTNTVWTVQIPVYSTVLIPLTTNSGNTFNFTVDSEELSIIDDGTQYLPTLYTMFHDDTPPDNTPLLTQFFDLFISKISYCLEEFSTNYLYLSIFSIFIIYILIFFIRGRFS